jgi:hypothetical protein
LIQLLTNVLTHRLPCGAVVLAETAGVLEELARQVNLFERADGQGVPLSEKFKHGG